MNFVHYSEKKQSFYIYILTYARRHELRWLDIPECIQFRTAVTVHRCLNGLAPAYLTDRDVNEARHLEAEARGPRPRPESSRPRSRPEVRGQGRERSPNSVQKCHGPKTTIVIPKHSSTVRWIKSESDRAFH